MILGNKRKASEVSDKTIYTCSMHPEVQSTEPGNCPQCGMFLVSKTDVDDSGHKHEEARGGCCCGHGRQHDSHAISGDRCCGGHKHEQAHQ